MILYKGKNLYGDSYVYGFPYIVKTYNINTLDNNDKYYIITENREMIRVKSLHQYIGIDDINENKIFEGDKVEVLNLNDTIRGTIKYIPLFAQFKLCDEDGFCFELTNCTNIKLI